MDIEVKNSLDRALMTCKSVENISGKDMRSILAKDICCFISNISTNGADERFNYFSKVYLGGDYKSENLEPVEKVEIPESIRIIDGISDTNSSVAQIDSKPLVAFFTTLGRSYLSSKTDRKDIDMDLFLERIESMNNHVKEASSYKMSQKNSSEKSETSHRTDSDGDNEETVEIVAEESLEDLLKQLEDLIGLDGVKKEVREIINLIKVRNKGHEFGIEQAPLSLHLVFSGNPGTGKTTVARLLAKIYKQLGVLSSGQLIEVDRGAIVAGYIGQTATKTQEKINEAMGGILFIDEAYTLTHGKGETDFGQEAVDTILKAMEDHRDDFIVIVAGYPDLMKEFVESNPGLKSRFNQYIYFEDYKPEELLRIFKHLCEQNHQLIEDDCDGYLKSYFENVYRNRQADYANGRDVRNYYEKVYRAKANRLGDNIESATSKDIVTIKLCDLKEAAANTSSL